MSTDPNAWWSKDNLQGVDALEPVPKLRRMTGRQRIRAFLLIGALLALGLLVVILFLNWLKHTAV